MQGDTLVVVAPEHYDTLKADGVDKVRCTCTTHDMAQLEVVVEKLEM